MSDGRQVLGRDEIEGYMRRFLAQWSDFRAEAEDRDRVVVTVRWERRPRPSRGGGRDLRVAASAGRRR